MINVVSKAQCILRAGLHINNLSTLLLVILWYVESAHIYSLIPAILPALLDFIYACFESTWGQISLFNLRGFASAVHPFTFLLLSPISEAFPDHIIPPTYSPVLLCSSLIRTWYYELICFSPPI